jgi:hypothetical protein
MKNHRTADLNFENVWRVDAAEIRKQAIALWKQSPILEHAALEERAGQIVFVAKNNKGQVVAITTAYKAFVKQMNNYFYMYRCLVVHEYSFPGLETKLTILTRDFLESVYNSEKENLIGMMAIVQHPKLKELRKAVWPATQLTYIGNTANGDHIRVYYFRKAEIALRT